MNTGSGVSPVRAPRFRIGASFGLAWSPDGGHLLTIGKRVTRWDVSARKRVASLHPFPHEASVDVSPNGRGVAVKNTLGDVVLLDLETLVEKLRLSGAEYGEGSSIRFSPDGDYVIDGSWRGDLIVRDAATGTVVLHERGGAISQITSTPDHLLWLYSRHDLGCVLRRWPFDQNEPIVFEYSDFLPGPHALALAPDATAIATASYERIQYWLIAGERLELVAEHPVPAGGTGESLAWHPAGDAIAYAGGGQALVFGPGLEPIWAAEFSYPSDVAYSPDGRLLAIGDWSKGVVIPAPDGATRTLASMPGRPERREPA